MARFRRLAAIVGAAALAGAVVGGPARADSPEVFQGSAVGTALDLSILGKQVTLGSSSAKADSTGKAEAKGAGVLTPVFSTQKAASASGATATTDNKAKTCRQVPGLTGVEALSIGLACSSAKATSGPTPSATGAGSVVEAGVDASTVINKIVAAIDEADSETEADLAPVRDGITNIGGTVAGLLDPVCEKLQGNATAQQEGADDLACAATTTVEDLVTSVLKTKTLEVAVGSTTSSVDTTTSSVTSKAGASGAVVKLLPLPQVDGLPSTQPVVTITVGEANASATYDRSAGSATGTADPAIVRISFNTVLTDALADRLDLPAFGSLNNIVLQPSDLLGAQEAVQDALTKAKIPDGVPTLIEPCEDGRAVCILKGTPLESRIYLATSKVTTNADGSVVATADAVRMELATGTDFEDALNAVEDAASTATVDLDLTGPGVRLALGGVEAGVGGSPGQVDKQNNNGGGGDDGGDGGSPDNGAPALTPEQSRTLPPAELPRTGGTPWVPLVGATALALAVIGRRAAAKAIR